MDANSEHPKSKIRKGLAFAAGFFAMAFSSLDSAGMLAIIFLPLIFGIIGAIGLLFAIAFRGLLVGMNLENWWERTEAPALAVMVLGIGLLYTGTANAVPAPQSDPQEPTYVYGPTRWPGYFLLVAAVGNFPRERRRSRGEEGKQ